MSSKLILINPWIYDFAAYDLWSKPLGLLYLAAYLRQSGFHIHLIDCLDVHHPAMLDDASGKAPKRRQYGTGKFWKTRVLRPHCLSHIERPYSRYGILPQAFLEDLKNAGRPAAILVTSLMTYWYPGVVEAIALAREVYPDVPIILGGIYARLCQEHAVSYSNADHVVTDNSPMSVLTLLNHCGIPTPGKPPERLPYPAFDLLNKIDYLCLLTSRGCPYRCQYCASHFLDPVSTRRETAEVLDEILFWHSNHGIRDFAFYDDALLVGSDRHMSILLEDLARRKMDLRFHTPNALHVKEITPELASLMYRTGFKTIRLGLETADFSLHKDLDNKVCEGDFDRAIHNLLKAGFNRNEIGAYMLVGLPNQSVNSVVATINFVGKAGVMPFLAEYSPIPHTALWETALRYSEYDLVSEPLLHNNTLLPCWNDDQKNEMPKLRRMVLAVRQKYR